MVFTGILSVVNGESRLDDGTLLARCANPSPLFAATAFVKSQGCEDGDRIQAEGETGLIGGVVVFCINSAQTVGVTTECLRLGSSKALAKPAAKQKQKRKRPRAKKAVKRKAQKKTVQQKTSNKKPRRTEKPKKRS